jgi:hypothetical protein
LTAGGKVVTQELVLTQDPRQTTKPEVLAQSLAFTLAVRDTISSLTQKVHQLRAVKKQLESRNELLASLVEKNPTMAALVKQSKDVIAKCDSLENKFHNAKAKISYDILAGVNNTGAQLYSVLCFVYDICKSSDEKTTQGSREVFAEEVKRFETFSKEWDTVLSNDLGNLNKTAQSSGVPHIFVVGQK